MAKKQDENDEATTPFQRNLLANKLLINSLIDKRLRETGLPAKIVEDIWASFQPLIAAENNKLILKFMAFCVFAGLATAAVVVAL